MVPHMTPRLLGIALLCVGTLMALVAVVVVMQPPLTHIHWAFLITGSCGAGLMICGYFIGKRKSWD